MLKVENLSVSTGPGPLFERVGFTIAPGETVLLGGPSGSGKSTLLRALLFFQPFTGILRWEGTAVDEDGIEAYRSRIAFLGQRPPPDDGSAADVLLAPFSYRANRGRRPPAAALPPLLAKLRLAGALLDRPFTKLSGGEKQRLLLARLLLLGRKTLFLDEPTAALDAANRRRAIRVLQGIRDMTLLVVSHDPEWHAAADRCLELRGGRLRGGRA